MVRVLQRAPRGRPGIPSRAGRMSQLAEHFFALQRNHDQYAHVTETHMSEPNRSEIEALHERITAAFKARDLDTLMTLFTDDAVYIELTGRENRGKTAIRKAFEPQFRGAFGDNHFISEGFFVDANRGYGFSTWQFVLTQEGKTRQFEGMDIYRFKDGLIQEKHTFSRTKAPLYREVG
jgi:ketosteroid isomerase-like protein